jgi:hypothetical protein
MSTAQQPAQMRPRAQAEALADALSRRGLTTTVLTKGGHHEHPCVHAVHRRIWYLNDDISAEQGRSTYIYLAPENGCWWFWWPSLRRIALASDITQAADTITRALKRTTYQAAPGNGSQATAAGAPGTAAGAA